MEENLHEIDILIEEYPYYSLLYFKRAKLLADGKNETYKNALKLASVYAPNRRKLQEFIENPTDYRKQIVVHPEWLSENTETHNYTLNVNDDELIKEVLTLEEPQASPFVVQETPITKEVEEIKDILSHFTEEISVQNNTIQEIEHLKQTIQQNQEKARLALFQSEHKEKTTPVQKVNTTITQETTFFTEEIPIVQENITEEENITEKTETVFNTVVSDVQEKQLQEVAETEIQQKPVSLNVPKIKEWFEQELQAVRSEKEEKENKIPNEVKTEKNEIKTENGVKTQVTDVHTTDLSAEGYISWLDELLGMEKNIKKATETKTTTDKRAIQDSIIDKFLQNTPKINKPVLTETSVIEDKTQSQTVEYEDIASETLAKIFVMQKQYDRAIRIYQVLISKNPSQKEQYEKIIKDIQSKMN